MLKILIIAHKQVKVLDVAHLQNALRFDPVRVGQVIDIHKMLLPLPNALLILLLALSKRGSCIAVHGLATATIAFIRG